MSSIKLSRRSVLGTLAYGIGASRFSPGSISGIIGSRSSGWSKEWDAALLSAEMVALGKSYDPSVQLINTYRGPESNYQSKIRNKMGRSTRASPQYASLLLWQDDTASVDRAVAIINRVVSLQVMNSA